MCSFYTNLPTELQLRVLDHLPAISFCNVLQSNTSLNSLALSSVNSTINNLTDNGDQSFYISIFSPQNKRKLIETFNTICVSNPSSQLHTPSFEKSTQSKSIDLDQLSNKLNELDKNNNSLQSSLFIRTSRPLQSQNFYNTIFQLGDLEYKKSPLKLHNTQIPVKSDEKTSAMSLVVNDEEPFIKVQFEMQMQSESNFISLFKFNTRLKQIHTNNTSVSGTLISENKAVSVDYTLHKGDELPPRGGYDYDVFHHYDIQFGSFQINATYLLHCYEQNK